MGADVDEIFKEQREQKIYDNGEDSMKVYADNAATTQMSRTAIVAMLPYMERVYGNPSSLYSLGQEAAERMA